MKPMMLGLTSVGHGYLCRAFAAQLTRTTLTRQIEQRVAQVNATLAEQDRKAISMNPKGRRA